MLRNLLVGSCFLSGLFAAAWLTAAERKTSGADASTKINISREVDRLLSQELEFDKQASKLAPRTSDEVFLRRVTIDLIGELPTPAELTLFAFDPAADKRAKVVERLLQDSRYGRNWARYWRDVIFYRRVEDRALLGMPATERYLTDQLNENAGWDKIAQAFVSATGDVSQVGETALISAQMGEPVDVASEVSRIFLGIQIQCAQCHNHPTDRWKREQFHEFAAFFPRIGLRPVLNNGQVRGFEVVSADYGARRPGGARRDPEHYLPDLKDPGARGKQMTPVFFATNQSLQTGATDVVRRDTLGDWITSKENPWFARAFVNRMWAELVGEGFYEPVDDLGPDRKPSSPQTVELVSIKFARRGYDIRWLMATIIDTAAYQRESRPRRLPDATPFTANVSQRMRADQILDVLTAGLGVEPIAQNGMNRGPGNFALGLLGPRFFFGQIFGFDPSASREDVTTTIPQSLVLMNGQQLSQAINARNSQTQLGKIVNLPGSEESRVVELYLRTLAREPNPQELQVSLDYLKQTTSRAEAYEDLLWALINRTEFIHRN